VSARSRVEYAAGRDLRASARSRRRRAACSAAKTTRSGWIDCDKTTEEAGETCRRGTAVGLGAPVVKSATNPGAAQRLREMWLKEGRHFAVKTPEDNHDGYVYILREGSAYAAWPSVYGSEEQQKPAAEFVKYILRRAEEAGIPDAEYRVKQFVLELIDILARAGERYRRDALRAVSTVEKALRATAFAGLSAAALYSVYTRAVFRGCGFVGGFGYGAWPRWGSLGGGAVRAESRQGPLRGG
jgi:hypothetical protein